MKIMNLIPIGGALLLGTALVLGAGPWEMNRPAEGVRVNGDDQKEQPATFPLKAAAFEDGGWIPKKCTCDGANTSPALQWGEPSAGTQSFALIVEDPDAPKGIWVHWVAYNIPAGARSLPEGLPNDRDLPDGTRQGLRSSGKIGYGGPCPPPGPAHRYFFKLYALNLKIDLPPGASKSDLEQAMTGHIVSQAETMGRFQRQP